MADTTLTALGIPEQYHQDLISGSITIEDILSS